MVDVNNISGGNASGGAPIAAPKQASPGTPLPSLQRPQAAQVSAAVSVPEAPAQTDEARFAKVEQAAAEVITNPYPVSNHRFTIFKDIGGDYVTRFTSLEDGSVKYYPEKTLFEFAQILQTRAGGGGSSFDTEA